MIKKLFLVLSMVVLVFSLTLSCENAQEISVIDEADHLQKMINLADKLQLELDMDNMETLESEGASVIGIPVKGIEYLPEDLFKKGVYVSLLYFSGSKVTGDYDGLYIAKAVRENKDGEPVVQLIQENQIVKILESNPSLENASEYSEDDANLDNFQATKASCDYVGRWASYYKNGPRYTKTKCIGVVYLCKNYVWHSEWDCPGYKASSWKACGACFGFKW